ncbi:hypothetical protein CUZ56_01352 [Saezia sanguinis]|uniref:TIGR03757 family integrating conjugative element protein n=1 Tax=Saezia sanguinis TaxID=1965230 RepID=A0A433SF86_9BURK|nr:TIGR03757 family integrating conjugative element protein [Saezia sanguinis]RUS67407.1 hypothetical protein CUZ56_01352 [Saezia sanguinis]
MMNLTKSLLLTFIFTTSSVAYALDILVITDEQHIVYNVPPNAKVIHLDEAQNLEERISEGLPADTAKAVVIAKQRLTDQEFQKTLTQAYQNIANAYALGVVQIPAVVVAQRYVIYGQPNIWQALDDIRQYQEADQ